MCSNTTELGNFPEADGKPFTLVRFRFDRRAVSAQMREIWWPLEQNLSAERTKKDFLWEADRTETLQRISVTQIFRSFQLLLRKELKF